MPKSREQLKQEYITSLDSFISKNPTVGQLDTAKFRDFLIGLVEHESGFNPTARQGSYFGWYQTNKLDADPYVQHMNAFNHLNGLFNNTITKEDVQRARSLGINDSALMLKYWNQGNRVNNYLWNNKDSADGLGTKISNYGNDLTMPLDVYGYAMDNLYGDYTVKQGDNWFNIQKRVRIPGRDYATGGKDLWNMQNLGGTPFGYLRIGQSFKFGKKTTNSDINTTEEPLFLKKTQYLNELANRINKNREYVINSYKSGGKTKSKRDPLVYHSIEEEDIYSQPEETDLVYKTLPEDYFGLLEDSSDEGFPIEGVKIYNPFINQIKYTEVEKKEDTADTNLTSETSIKEATDVGEMQELVDLMRSEGISFRITSGFRRNAITRNGAKSYHGEGRALDIVPAKGQTWNDLIGQMKRSSKFIAYMKSHGLGILDERSKEMQAKTGATGPHFHIGPDKSALSNFEILFG